MRDTLEILNRLQADGVIETYAIGRAVGATFYVEPAATVDIDIFISVANATGSALVRLSPIYDYLTRQRFPAQGEYIVIMDGRYSFWSPVMRWKQRLSPPPER